MTFEALLMNIMAARSDKKRDAGMKIPDDVRYIEGLSYGTDLKYHTLDICYPASCDVSGAGTQEEGAKKVLPVIISFHGGGYVYGSTKIYKFYCADLAKRGFCVINFNYRLAPKYKYPAPLEDLSAVIDHLIANRNAYPMDLSNVFLLGDSAGAQLASQYAVIDSNPAYRAIMGFRKKDITIRAVGLNCGMYDLKDRVAKSGPKGVMRDYLGSDPDKYGEQLDVLRFITSDFPPAYLFSAEGDFLKDACEPMAQLLRERGVECESKIYGDKSTGHVFHVNVRLAVASEANDDETAFFRKYIKDEQ